MSVTEWLGESYNPGDIGDVEFGASERPPRSRFAVLLRCLVAWSLLGTVYCLIFASLSRVDTQAIVITLLVTVIYLALGYFVHPRPDTSNLGWLGGFFDHPFRYSDDINRSLFVLRILLWPGRFIAETVVEFPILLAKSRRHARLPR